jgi:hypothetical protein
MQICEVEHRRLITGLIERWPAVMGNARAALFKCYSPLNIPIPMLFYGIFLAHGENALCHIII